MTGLDGNGEVGLGGRFRNEMNDGVGVMGGLYGWNCALMKASNGAQELYCCSLALFFSRRYQIPPTAALLLYPPVDSVIDRDTGVSCCYIAAVLMGSQKNVR